MIRILTLLDPGKNSELFVYVDDAAAAADDDSEEDCFDNEFMCISGEPRCIPDYQACDMSEDCQDGSDEYHQCSQKHIHTMQEPGETYHTHTTYVRAFISVTVTFDRF